MRGSFIKNFRNFPNFKSEMKAKIWSENVRHFYDSTLIKQGRYSLNYFLYLLFKDFKMLVDIRETLKVENCSSVTLDLLQKVFQDELYFDISEVSVDIFVLVYLKKFPLFTSYK